MYLLELMGYIRSNRLDDEGGSHPIPAGYYAYWQYDDTQCLWKNREIIQYIKSAIIDIYRRAPWETDTLQSDTISSPTRIAITALNPELSLSNESLIVDQARLVSNGQVIRKTERSKLLSMGFIETNTGTPIYYFDLRPGKIKLYPIPIMDDELHCVVRRRVATDFYWSDVESESYPTFELSDIPDDLFEPLVSMACSLAYQKRDADTFSAELAQKFASDVTQMIGPPVSKRQFDARQYNANMDTAIRGFSYCKSSMDED